MTSTTRRRFVTRAALAGSAFVIVGDVAAQDDATPRAASTEMVGQIEAPRWIFTVYSLEDPYAGKLTRPEEPVPGFRYISALVEINNASDQPLEFATSDVRLRDEQGVEYPAGAVSGREPKLQSQNLPGGEKTRGAVWFGVPEDIVTRDLTLVAPAPQLRVLLPA